MTRMITAALLATLTLAHAQEQKVEEGFTSIFNGKDLTGWKYGKRGNGEHKDGVGYQVENGVV